MGLSVDRSGLGEDLRAEYDIFLMRYDDEGESRTEVISGEARLEEVLPQLDETFETESVQITLDCETSSSCPTCERHAASVKRERVIGLRVRLYNSDDEQLTEFHSSNAVRKLGEEEDAKKTG